MKTKSFFLIAALIIGAYLPATAQNLILSEDFSSPEWQAELLRLNPGADDFGVLINPNATNPLPYAPKSPATGANKNTSYNVLNSTDKYFGKYNLVGDIETIAGMNSDVCAYDGGNHNVLISDGGAYDGQEIPLGFRMNKTTGYMEFPEISTIDSIILHVRGGNNDLSTELSIQKYENSAWTEITRLPVQNRSAIWDYAVDEILKYEMPESDKNNVKIRIAHTDTQPFFQIYQVDIWGSSVSALHTPETAVFTQNGRKLTLSEPMNVSVFSILGKTMLETSKVEELDIPASLGNGIFIIKTEKGNQKIFLK